MTERRRGQCLCGAVKFVAESVETHFGSCHCKMCQRWAGGPFMSTSVGNVIFEGDENIRRFRSSEWAERGFCKNCGSNLYYRVLKLASHEMCIGVFDETQDFVLNAEIFIDRKPPGYALAGDHERLTEAQTMARYT